MPPRYQDGVTHRIERGDALKQRRLLLGFTFALAAVHGLDVSLGTTVSAQGLVLHFRHEWVIVVALWVAWAFELWRYWQYERTFSAQLFDSLRQTTLTRATYERVLRQLQSQVDAGKYGDRIPKGTKIGEIHSDDPAFGTQPSFASEWIYPRVKLWAYGSDHQKLEPLDGGANCTLDAADIAAIHERVQRELRVAHPGFADWKLPYAIAGLAPVAGLVDLARSHFVSILPLLRTVGVAS